MTEAKTYPPPFTDPEFAREMDRKGALASARARAGKGFDKGDAQAGIRAVEVWLKA